MEQPIPAEPTEITLHAWDLGGVGDFGISTELDFAERLDAAVLAKAVELLVVHAQPLLKTRLNAGPDVAEWVPLPEPLPQLFWVTKDADEFERLRHTSPDCTRGPQFAAYLYQGPDFDRLHFKSTHQLSDGNASKVLGAQLADIYSRLLVEPDYVPPLMPQGDRGLDQILARVTGQDKLSSVPAALKMGWDLFVPRQTHKLHLPEVSEVHPWRYVTREVSPERMTALATYGRARGATLNDVFLAAYYRALLARRKWDGKSALRVVITLDLRQWFLPADRAPNLCDLSAFVPTTLHRDPGRNYDETLQRVIKLTKVIKQGKPGLVSVLYGIPRAKPARLTQKRIAQGQKFWRDFATPILTNGGRIDGESLRFGGQKPSGARQLSISMRPPVTLVSICSYENTMCISAAVADAARPEVAAFLDELVNQLPA